VGAQSKFSGIDEPELTGALKDIFDLAWQEIHSASGCLAAGDNADKRRDDLALMIILAYRSGLQPEEIKAALLGDGNSPGVRRDAGACMPAGLGSFYK
jgi:hypothetical protein